jgi:subtilisin family serine protease
VRQFQDLPFIVVSVGRDGLQTLDSLHGLVSQVVEDGLNWPFLAESIPLVQADQVWAGGFGGLSYDGSGTVVAILDTGVDNNHPFLGNVVEEACFSSNDAASGATSLCPGGATSSFAAGSAMPCTVPNAGCDHGTHVAGIATGSGQSFSGVARGANVMAVQVFSRFDSAMSCGGPPPCIAAFTSDVMAGLERVYARRTAHNIASVNVSLGGSSSTTFCDNDSRKPIIDLLRAASIVMVIASGNNGLTNAISRPACISTAVSVGSTDDGSFGTTVDAVSSFSNSATFLSLLAPGRWINSSVTPGNGFANFAGTSMATPHVAGAFAIFKQALPNLTVSEVLGNLQSTGLPVLDTRNSITKPRIRVLNALQASSSLPVVSIVATDPTATEQGTTTGSFTVSRTGSTAAALTVNYSVSGTATAGSDYQALAGSVVIPSGQSSATITVTPIDDAVAGEPDETVIGTVSPNAAYAVGAPSSATVTITDNDPMPGTGLIGHWTFDEGMGITAGDSSGNGHAGILTNGPAWTTPGQIGGALSFDGIDDYVDFGTFLPVAGGGSRTVSLWIKPSASDVAGFMLGWGTEPNHQYFRLANPHLPRIITGGGNCSANVSLTPNAWSHIAFTGGNNLNTYRISLLSQR